ncbi:MAG: hypothetical protein E7623_07855 [Ruminococcaceae bacterium]|nr:hypothetical protein [Oscillospiraceae bacterium]
MNPFDNYKKSFKDPDRRYAIFPIIHSGIGGNTDFDYFDRCGFAGVVGNVSYRAFEFPNRADDWKRAEAGYRGFAEKGMHTWIYDESGYPSGTAGGYVTEHFPEYIAKGLYCYDYWRVVPGPTLYRADVPGDKLWKAVLVPCDGGDPIDVTHFLNENNVLYIEVPKGNYHLFMMSIRRLFDGTHATESYCEPRNYISLSDKNATKAFMSVTHERYKEILGDEFGKSILAMFTDEPSLISWNIRYAVFPILPWLDTYPEDFKQKYGYDLWLACVAVVLRMGNDQAKRRCDFWEFIADTVADSYFKTIQDWCHENGLKSSGHMLEEERLQAHIINYGSFYRSMKHMDWPGIDQLETEPSGLMNENSIPIARFIASFADINGEHEAFTEFSDHCVRMRGETSPIDHYYQSVNWHHAMGINNFTSYYSWTNISDDQKLQLNRYTARAGYLLRKGKRDSKVALFYPEASMWEAYQPTTKERAINSSYGMMSVQNAFTKTSWNLLHRQIDFDYVDSEILTKAEIIDGKLCYRDREYEAIIMPCTRVLEDNVASRIPEFAEKGVQVYFCTESVSISRNSGEASPYAQKINDMISEGKGIYLAEDADSLAAVIDEKLPLTSRPVRTENNDPMILTHTRITEDGERIIFISNMGEKEFCGDVTLYGTYDNVMIANCRSGEISPLEYCDKDGSTVIHPSIASGDGIFILLK